MTLKDIETRLAAIKQELDSGSESLSEAQLNALEQETKDLTEERKKLLDAMEKRNVILQKIAAGAGTVTRSFASETKENSDDPAASKEYRTAWLKKKRNLPLTDAEARAYSNAMENGIGIQNSADITFPTAPSAAGKVTYLGLFDAKTSGNMLAYGALSSPQGVEAGEAPVIVAGEAKWYLTGNMSAYFKAAVLNILRGQSLEGFSPYLALYNGSPDAAGTELSGGGYQRQELSFSAPEQQSGNECSIATDSAVQTARATAAWGTWAQTVIMDAAEGGHAIFYKEKSPAKVMRKGLLVMIDPGNLSLTVN